MFNKLLSRLSPDQTAHTPEEKKILSLINSPEKAKALRIQLETELLSVADYTPARQTLIKKIEEVARVIRKHDIENQRENIAQKVKKDKAECTQNLEQETKALGAKDAEIEKLQGNYEALKARIEKLKPQIDEATTSEESRLNAAQASFDAAVSTGDEQAETAASECLFQLKTEGKKSSGSLLMRLDAVLLEAQKVQTAIETAQQARQDVSDNILKINAELALIEYDEQLTRLIDAYAKQFAAVRVCKTGNRPAFGVNTIDLQTSSNDRVILCNTLQSTRRISTYAIDQFATDICTPVNLSLLTETPA